MGSIRAAYGDPARAVHEAASRQEERLRKSRMLQRVQLYQDAQDATMYDMVATLFNEPAVRERMYQLLKLALANNPLKRITDEIARPVYSIPPVRKLEPASARAMWADLAREMRLNAKLDLATRLMFVCNAAFLFVRFVATADGGRLVLDVLTPDMVTVLPDPDCPQEALGIAYDTTLRTPAGVVKVRTVWDDEEYFSVSTDGVMLRLPVAHGFGRKPWVEIHRRARWGSYWDTTTGGDLVAATIQVALLNTLILKLHKSQGHLQLAFSGDDSALPQEQALDEENVLLFPAGQLSILNLQADPGNYIKTKTEIETTVAANYGISRERLNQQQPSSGEHDAPLRERTAEIVQVMTAAELDLCDVVTRVSQEHPTSKLPGGCTMAVDYHEVAHRVDRKTVLELRQTERSMGVRSVLDDIYEDNPEIAGDEEAAWAEIDRNMAAEAEYIRRRRALNVPEDATVEEPGQDAEDNGRMGPMVRDGTMTRDEAATMGKGGNDMLTALARRVLDAE